MADPIHLQFGVATTDLDAFLRSLGAHLARGGLFIPSQAPHPEGTRVTFEFVQQDHTPLFSGEGVVVASRRPGGPVKPGMLVRLGSLLHDDLVRLERAVAMQEGTHDAPLPASASAPGEPSDPMAPPGNAPRRSRPSSGPELTLGLDFGGTCLRACVLAERTVRHLDLEGRRPVLPSAVAWDDRGRLMLGARAHAQQAVDPRSALVGFRRLLGLRPASDLARSLTARLPYEVCADACGEGAVRVRGRVIPLVEAASVLLAEVRNRASVALGQPVRHVVLTAPQLSHDRQRQALRLAAHLAGLKVDLLLSDPIAAALAWCHTRGPAPRTLLVFDLGGSSFAASVVRVSLDHLEVLGSVDDRTLGGEAYDARLARFLEEGFRQSTGAFLDDPLTRQRVRDAAEAAKTALSQESQTRVHVPWAAADVLGKPIDLELALTRAQFDPLVADLASRAVLAARALCQRCGVGPAQLAEVLLVGGQSQSAVVRLALEAAFGDKVVQGLPPTQAVSTGAAIAGWAQRLEPRRSGPQAAATLRESLHLGLADETLHCLLEKGVQLPCERACQVVVGPQGMVRLSAWQSNDAEYSDPVYLGSLHLRAAPGEAVEVIFSVSRTGVLTLTGRTARGGAVLGLPTADLSDEGRRELDEAAPLPEPLGREVADLRKLLGMSAGR